MTGQSGRGVIAPKANAPVENRARAVRVRKVVFIFTPFCRALIGWHGEKLPRGKPMSTKIITT